MSAKNPGKLRRLVAEEAAKLIASGAADFHSAKQKAAARYGAKRDLPDNSEIERALIERQNLFGENRQEMLLELRQNALQLMLELERFEPHLVGAVLSGTATEYSDIQLHIFSDSLKNVAVDLIDRNISFRSVEKEIAGVLQPGFEFKWQHSPVEMLVFDDEPRISPPSPIDGKPMVRASVEKVTQLVSSFSE